MLRVRLVRSSTAALAVALVVSTGVASRAVAPSAAEPVSAAAPGTTKRVLVISVDGLNPNAIKKLGRSGAPAFYRLLDDGASTFNARTEYEQTVTLPNHTSMLTGRRIDKTKGGHGVTWDDDRPGTTVQGAAGHGVSSVFTSVHKAGGSTALFASKTKFTLYDRSWPQGIDRFRIDENNTALTRATRSDLVDRSRDFTFLHLSLPDRVGHESGFLSPAYVDAVDRVDALVGKLLRAIDNHTALSDDLVVILTADHGGKGPSHSDMRRLANYRVPFLVWGPGVTNDDLYDLNADYENPGRSRPTYVGKQPVRNGDVANLAGDLLGLGPVAGSELDAMQDLDVN